MFHKDKQKSRAAVRMQVHPIPGSFFIGRAIIFSPVQAKLKL
ncbi:hypothetical protein GBL_1243 [Geobacillus kaustophilus GBlys]|uniref:Uncharacterized protein n=2 Tax=Geobacillus TaxID=129337 RepID=A0A7U9JBI3_GEOTM|nr:hypothetical protein T260_08250 [Geobacillus sp. MAS1]GAD13026.1 hypothetical protein GBL_1243 [Geobacillus kaustophilus GBlys]